MISILLFCAFNVGFACGFLYSNSNNNNYANLLLQSVLSNDCAIDRSSFLRNVLPVATGAITMIGVPPAAEAIDFVPASPFFTGTYQDALEIVKTQRLAVDNISNVIQDGNLEEAGFKVMQLSAQTRAGGKIILDTFQEKITSSKTSEDSSVILLRLLNCQKKFAILLDLYDECDAYLNKALKGKLGATTAAQLKTSAVVNETKLAYDDFLTEVETIERALFSR